MTDTLTAYVPTEAPDVESLLYLPGVYSVTITADLAQRLLERNTGNRKPKERAIAQYADDMKRGMWRRTNQGLGFDHRGTLVDGQNRLMACVQAGRPFDTLIATGLESEAKDVVDTGVKRSFSDVLRMNGMPTNAVQIGAGVSMRMRYDILVEQKAPVGKVNLGWKRVNHEDMLRYLEEHPAIPQAAHMAWVVRKAFPRLPLSTIVCFESMALEIDEDALSDFRNSLLTGALLEIGDPILAMRNYLTRMDSSRRGGPQPVYLLGLMIKAWNDWRHGEHRELLALRDNEPMPTIDRKPAARTTWKRRKHTRERAERVALKQAQGQDA